MFTWRRYFSFCFWNFIIPPVLGVFAFALFSIIIRSENTWVERIGGSFFVVLLALPFSFFIFAVPGLFYTGITSLVSVYAEKRKSLAIVSALVLGGSIFPIWLFLVSSPIDKMWPLISAIGSLCCALGVYFTFKINERPNKRVDSTAGS
jgi:hypothetical protein